MVGGWWMGGSPATHLRLVKGIQFTCQLNQMEQTSRTITGETLQEAERVAGHLQEAVQKAGQAVNGREEGGSTTGMPLTQDRQTPLVCVGHHHHQSCLTNRARPREAGGRTHEANDTRITTSHTNQ